MLISKKLYALAIALLMLCGASGYAQTVTAGVNGTVTDPSGATITGAKITATNVETNVSTSAQTNKAGVYRIRFLTIGQYKVTIDAPGFAAQTLGPFTLEAGQDAKFDAKLALEGASTNVEVNGGLVPLLNTENAELGSTLNQTAIENFPLPNRNFAELAVFTPGAVSTNPQSFAGIAGIERDTLGGSVLSINGNRAQTNNYLLDGIEINETVNNLIGYNPSPDALQQVRVVSANAQAEYGNVNGGDIIALLKNGTNELHGSAFFRLSNYKMNANSWANNYNRVPKSGGTTTFFGGTLGGPILRDKLFFFGDYQGSRSHSGGVGTVAVATAKMRQGDFSELLDPAIMCAPGQDCVKNNPTIQLYDPFAPVPFTPYVGNLNVPITNPVAKYLYAHPEFYPLPNRAPNAGSPTAANYEGPKKLKRYNDQFDVRIDFKASAKDSFFGSYSQSDAGDYSTSVLAIQFPGQSTYPTKGIALNWVRTISPSLVNEFRVGFFRPIWHQGVPQDTTGAFGMNGNAVVGIQGGNQVPGFAAQNISGITAVGAAGSLSDTAENNFTYGDNLTWQKGRHTFKFGAQFIRYQQNIVYSGLQGGGGAIGYTGAFTKNPKVTNKALPKANGYGLADFNLDRVMSVGRGTISGAVGQRQWRDAVFAQDDWKLRPNLTLNLGMRWEYDQPIYEVNDKQTNYDLQTGAVLLAGKNGNSRALYNPVYTNFMPRVGFSYNPIRRFVMRGGFGTTIFMEGTGANLRLIINPPWQPSVNYAGVAPAGSNPGEYTTAEAAFSSHSADCDPLTDRTCAITLRAWDPNLRPAVTNEFSLTTEYQLSNTASFQVGYVGETGQHLIQANNGNQLTHPCFDADGNLLGYNSAACFAVNKAPFYQLAGQSGFMRITQSEGMMNYNALQAVLRQRKWHGLQYTVNYTYSRSLTNTNGFYAGDLGLSIGGAFPANPRDLTPEYGLAGTDVTHNLNFHMTYQLPFGRGGLIGSNVNRFVDEFIGGWRFAVSGMAYSGAPVNISTGNNTSGVRSGSARALRYRHMKIRHRSINRWFGDDPSTQGCTTPGVDDGVCAYGTPGYGVISVGRPNPERTPGYQQYNVAAFKDFRTFGEQRLTFRADAFNAFNIASYGSPVNSILSKDFGRITSTRSGPRNIQLSMKYHF